MTSTPKETLSSSLQTMFEQTGGNTAEDAADGFADAIDTYTTDTVQTGSTATFESLFADAFDAAFPDAFADEWAATFGDAFDSAHSDVHTVAWTEVQSGDFKNNWVNYGAGWNTCAYAKTPDGIVILKGMLKSGTVNTVFFTLPTGYRPAQSMYFANWHSSAYRGRIDSNGDIYCTTGTNNTAVCIDGICFKV